MKKRRKMSGLQKKEALAGYAFILPNFIGFIVFTAIPIVAGFVISFTNYSGFRGEFVGIANYARLTRDLFFRAALWNNLVYTFTSVPLTILLALLLALMLNRSLFGGGFFKTVYFFPNLTSMVAVSCVALLLFEPRYGPINNLLAMLGVPAENLPGWFFSSRYAMAAVVITVVWRSAGYFMVMFMGGLKTIPTHMYEAARIDGANSWQCFRFVTWPMLSPTTFMVAVLSFIWSFQVFDIINVTTEGGPGRATSVIVFRIYREAFREWRMGYASAMAYVLFTIIFIFTLIQWQGQKRWVSDDV
ncbi:MAG: sugar ABC transporter permease [Oscillospiraceae bacterium]|nr:sugar ABC transporter permease [Oscillospiraceae bacterium]